MTIPAPTALLAAAAFASAASAQIATFTFSDLDGSFDQPSSTFTAQAGTSTSGDVTRLMNALSGPPGSAQFDTGFAALTTLADVQIDLAVASATATSATGNGSLTITDHTGDTLTADISGNFSILGPAIAFDGALTNVFFNDLTSDGQFDGPSTGSFSSNFAPFLEPYEGTIIQLTFNPGAFFAQSFNNIPVLASGLIVPDPLLPPAPGGALAILGAGLIAARRRR